MVQANLKESHTKAMQILTDQDVDPADIDPRDLGQLADEMGED